jgi:predicted dehydrogenase
LRQAVAQGIVGDVSSVEFNVNWDHNWVQGTPFDRVAHLLLYDFAIHWFDLLTVFLPGEQPARVFASTCRSKSQAAQPPLVGQAHAALRPTRWPGM